MRFGELEVFGEVEFFREVGEVLPVEVSGLLDHLKLCLLVKLKPDAKTFFEFFFFLVQGFAVQQGIMGISPFHTWLLM